MALVSVLIIAALAKATLAQFGLQPQDKPAQGIVVRQSRELAARIENEGQ